jgi:uncharacterized protein
VAREAVTGPLSELASRMRSGGARVGLGELLGAHRALGAVDSASRVESYFALRAALCSSRADQALFAQAFADTFAGEPMPPELDQLMDIGVIQKPAPPRVGVPTPGEEALQEGVEPVPAAWSEAEMLREKDFASYTDAERALARRLLAQIARRGPTRTSRRTKPTQRRREVHDLRATVRASLRHGGELMERRWRQQTERPRRLVLVCDVSGSMSPYARMLLQYVQACVAGRARVEAFVFGTRLTRITRELEGRDPDRALARAGHHVADWSGGTRIGDSLSTLNRAYARNVGRGAVVVVLSDGWDRGDPILLQMEMQRLSRCAHSLIWLNPLKASPDYEPLTRGMQAALPHVDHFLAGNSIQSLEELADLLEGGLE